jgi:hypothetical protein
VRVVNPDALATVRVEEVQAVVDGAAVPLACNPGLPYVLGPSAGLSCAVLVNYNRGAVPDVLFGRAVFSTEVGTRRTVDGTGARFGWESADVSQARGACVRVSQGFATNWFELVQASGVAPSFDAQDPTTVCAPATWTFNVKFTPKDGAPCGPQQVTQQAVGLGGSAAADVARQRGGGLALGRAHTTAAPLQAPTSRPHMCPRVCVCVCVCARARACRPSRR